MIPIEEMAHWTRWDAKEESGINCGYDQAYINTNRANNFVLIKVNEYEFSGEATVSLRCYTNGDWKPDWGPQSDEGIEETFDGTLEDVNSLLEDAETIAEQWMVNHLCECTENEKQAIDVLTDILNSIRNVGLCPQPDAGLTGWTRKYGSTGFSLRPVRQDGDSVESPENPRDADMLAFNIAVDGKESGLRYNEYQEMDSDGEVRSFHDPKNTERLIPKITDALEQVGLTPRPDTIRKTRHQTHWDYSTGYGGLMEIPENLSLPNP